MHPQRAPLAKPRSFQRFACGLALTGLAVLTGCGVGKVTGSGDSGGTQLVVFASERNQLTGQFDIYLYDLQQLGFRLLTSLNNPSHADLNPAITGDAGIIAFVSNQAGGAGGKDIYLYSRVISSLFAQTGLNTAGDEDDPYFTGNAYQLAFDRDTLGHRRIRLLDAATDKLVPLPGLSSAAPTYDDWQPAPNVDGTKIAFVSNRNGNPDIFVYDATGDSLLVIPELVTDSTEVNPTLTPDGHYLAFASTRLGGSGGYDLYLFDLTTRVFVPLLNVNTAKDELNPSISADGNIIVFQSNRTDGAGKWDIWNHDRSAGRSGQGLGESSSVDDIDPYVIWN